MRRREITTRDNRPISDRATVEIIHDNTRQADSPQCWALLIRLIPILLMMGLVI
jgi:hypothetical protein